MGQEIGFRITAAVLLGGAFALSSRFRRRAERSGGRLDRSQGGRLLQRFGDDFQRCMAQTGRFLPPLR